VVYTVNMIAAAF